MMMPMQSDDDGKKPLASTFLRCKFVGGHDDDRCGGGGFTFTGEQLRYPCKLRRHICARCGMHRGEHDAGIRNDDLPPRKRPVFRSLGGDFQPPDIGGAGGSGEDDKREGQAWTPGDVIAKGKRGARRRRAAWCELALRFE